MENARKASTRALQLDPDLAEARVAAGQALSMEHRYQDAAAEFERAIQIDPTFFEAHYYYARSCFEAGDFEKAVRHYEDAQRARPEDYQPYPLMSLALIELGRGDEAHQIELLALQKIEKYLELNPDESRAYGLGAAILAHLGEAERATKWGEQAMSLAPDDPAILYNAACSFAVLGDAERALDGLERAITAGISIGAWVARDPDWALLRDHPRFHALLQRIAPS